MRAYRLCCACVRNIARRTLRTTDSRVVLPIAALMGAALLAGADLLAKNLFSPLELPVGIWTTVIGGPVLLILLRRDRAGGGRAHDGGNR